IFGGEGLVSDSRLMVSVGEFLVSSASRGNAAAIMRARSVGRLLIDRKRAEKAGRNLGNSFRGTDGALAPAERVFFWCDVDYAGYSGGDAVGETMMGGPQIWERSAGDWCWKGESGGNSRQGTRLTKYLSPVHSS